MNLMKKYNIGGKYILTMYGYLVRLYDKKTAQTYGKKRHSEISEYFPEIRKIPYEKVQKEDIMCGDVILVKDRTGGIAPYKNAIYEKKLIYKREECKNDKY